MDFLLVVASIIVAGSAAGTFLVVRTDLRRGPAVAVSAGTGLVVGLLFFLVVYLAVVAYLAALFAYVIVRRLWSARVAALTGLAAFGAVAVASVAVFAVALSTM
ncbi:hypothetical protein [Pseudosporangium ferrugineum]|uniref:Uncharacterized protein n=1 Tax=Pseudosporangium ferrugineum TaxID=439699 RepID=A0A2T0REE7_9ACTN|nr:hypothetical protein [Pseudosporangium ferrugineum]PRY19566.1 hypothetical protein CLV70_13125 [Pseudosporangium ferrugineum]